MLRSAEKFCSGFPPLIKGDQPRLAPPGRDAVPTLLAESLAHRPDNAVSIGLTAPLDACLAHSPIHA
jgi:hypothetical protein